MRYDIETIHAHEILDSRGNPTLQVSVMLQDGTVGVASVPSGASTGKHEAIELRDGDAKRYGGKGVLKAARNVNKKIAKALIGKKVFLQREIDDAMRILDGTENKRALGANAILGVSLACAHAGAKAKKMPLYKYMHFVFDLDQTYRRYTLPYPMMNIMNGGAHAGWLIDIQECMILPQQRSFRERLRCGAEVFHALGSILKERKHSTLVGDEGGYAVKLRTNEQALELLVEAIKTAKYKPGRDVKLGMDFAASEFYKESTGIYHLRRDKKKLSGPEMVRLLAGWQKKFPLALIEDGLAEDDWGNWEMLTGKLGKRVTLVGDDLFVTNVDRVQKGIDEGVANAVLIKVNQIGTLSESVDAILLAQSNGYKVAISHRSGETCDTTIADLAVAVNAEYIKTGGLSRSERLSKYNRLLAIEEELR